MNKFKSAFFPDIRADLAIKDDVLLNFREKIAPSSA